MENHKTPPTPKYYSLKGLCEKEWNGILKKMYEKEKEWKHVLDKFRHDYIYNGKLKVEWGKKVEEFDFDYIRNDARWKDKPETEPYILALTEKAKEVYGEAYRVHCQGPIGIYQPIDAKEKDDLKKIIGRECSRRMILIQNAYNGRMKLLGDNRWGFSADDYNIPSLPIVVEEIVSEEEKERFEKTYLGRKPIKVPSYPWADKTNKNYADLLALAVEIWEIVDSEGTETDLFRKRVEELLKQESKKRPRLSESLIEPMATIIRPTNAHLRRRKEGIS
jgi:hypothetical protein